MLRFKEFKQLASILQHDYQYHIKENMGTKRANNIMRLRPYWRICVKKKMVLHK